MLSDDQLEFLIELVADYLDRNDDLSHAEYGRAKSAMDTLDDWLGDE